MKAIIVIPTLNEEKSIPVLIDKLSIFLKTFTVLFVDDNSSDETQSRIKKSKKKYKNIKYIFKTNNFGIGNAIKDGIEFAYKHGYDMCITMDADGTHNPKYIPSLLRHVKKNSIVITNRFLSKNSINDWPFSRRLLTTIRYHLINFTLDICYDTSGAFRCYDLKIVKKKDILAAIDNGYSFFWESIFLLHIKKYKIYEISVDLPFRKLGSSKMKISDILSSLVFLLYYFLKRLFLKY